MTEFNSKIKKNSRILKIFMLDINGLKQHMQKEYGLILVMNMDKVIME